MQTMLLNYFLEMTICINYQIYFMEHTVVNDAIKILVTESLCFWVEWPTFTSKIANIWNLSPTLTVFNICHQHRWSIDDGAFQDNYILSCIGSMKTHYIFYTQVDKTLPNLATASTMPCAPPPISSRNAINNSLISILK